MGWVGDGVHVGRRLASEKLRTATIAYSQTSPANATHSKVGVKRIITLNLRDFFSSGGWVKNKKTLSLTSPRFHM